MYLTYKMIHLVANNNLVRIHLEILTIIILSYMKVYESP
jgi:hypothetical protein